MRTKTSILLAYPAVDRETAVEEGFSWATDGEDFVHIATEEKDDTVIFWLNRFIG